jgi:ATP-grasp enzyme of GAK system
MASWSTDRHAEPEVNEASNGPVIGVVGVSNRWSTERLLDAIEARTGRRLLVDMSRLWLDLDGGRVVQDDLVLNEMDALIVKKLGHSYNRHSLDRLEVLHFLDERGVRVFSRPTSMMRLLDRLSCTVTLRLGGIPMPETVVTEDAAAAAEAVGAFGRAILKPLFTSKARGMEVVEPGPGLVDEIERYRAAGNPVLYVQRMVPLPGADFGVVFLGGEYVASYARVAGAASWKTSTSAGGKYQKCDPPAEVIDLAQRAQALFDLDFTCVDIAEEPGGPVVFEVSAFGGFRGLWEAHGIQAAELYADYVVRKVAREG